MKKYIIALFISVSVGVISCTDDIASLNNNPKSYTNVPGPMLFTNAERNLFDAMASANVNRGIFRLTSQQWVETTYTDESRYDLKTRGISQNFWTSLYRDVLKDLSEATRLITADQSYTNPAQKAAQLAQIDLTAVYTWSVLVNTFGDIPYTKALDVNNLYPSYDDAATIYTDLFARIDADIAKLTATGFSASQDLMYAGSAAKWTKFANSLKLRLGVTLADINPTAASAAVQSAVAGGVFAANSDDAQLAYLNVTPNTNPVWVDLVQSGRQDFVACYTITDLLNATTPVDLRASLFFTFDQTGTGFSGGTPGVGNSFAKFSKASKNVTAQTSTGVLLSNAEVQFYLAEACERSLGGLVPADAGTYYNKGVDASINWWLALNKKMNAADATVPLSPLTQADIDAYKLVPGVAYAGSATWQQQIGTQKYLALYNRGFEAWTEVRRLDFPVMNTVVQAQSGFPNRFTYPIPEQNLNTANWTAASAKIEGGVDAVEARLFWDTK